MSSSTLTSWCPLSLINQRYSLFIFSNNVNISSSPLIMINESEILCHTIRKMSLFFRRCRGLRLELRWPVSADLFIPLYLHVPLIPLRLLFLQLFPGYHNYHSQLLFGVIQKIIVFLDLLLQVDDFFIFTKVQVPEQKIHEHTVLSLNFSYQLVVDAATLLKFLVEVVDKAFVEEQGRVPRELFQSVYQKSSCVTYFLRLQKRHWFLQVVKLFGWLGLDHFKLIEMK